MTTVRMLFMGIVCAVGTLEALSKPLIVDHTSVEKWKLLTQDEINRAKCMWVSILGQSHSSGYRIGCQLLYSNVDSRFSVSVSEGGPPEPFTTNHLRISRTFRNQYDNWDVYANEATWYTTSQGIDSLKRDLHFCSTNINRAVLGLGWSWQLAWNNPVGGGTNSIYGCQWAGSSVGGADGNLRWGLSSEDYPITGNRICMDTYLQATEDYRNYCHNNGIATEVIFTTAPQDESVSSAYQSFLKNEYIRSYVSNSLDCVLFDFADILCWDDSGSRKTNAWTDLNGKEKYYEWIAEDNYLNLDGSSTSNPYHIGERGAVRIAKALWYMLAVISAPEPIRVQSELVSGTIQLRFNAKAYTAYAVESSPDLSSWVVATNVPASSSDHEVMIEENTGGKPALFYRVSKTSGP